MRTAPALPAALRRAQELVAPELRGAVDRLSPEVRRVAAYHLGWADPAGRPVNGGGGKALRPALALLGAEAAGADPLVALPGAVAVELVHNFSLLHDDVMDHDAERRHRPTAWAVFGVGQAIVAGDALLTLAHQVLLDPPSPARTRGAALLAGATAEMIAGQAQDLAFESRAAVGFEECLRMSARKTAALLGCAASIGAVLGEADQRAVSALAAYGRHLGVAFQAVDDVLGIWGRPEVTGKPVGSDLRQGKKTLPVVAVLQAGDGAAARLRALLERRALTEEEVALAADLVERSGGRERTLALARRELALAVRSLAGGGLQPGPRAELEELAAFVATRER